MGVTKQKSSAAKNVAIFFVVFIILEMLILFGVSRVFKNKDVTPSFAGYSMYIMNSDEMGDSVPKKALVIAANGAPSDDAKGKAVLAENVPGIGTSVFRLAKVSSKGDSIDGVVYTLYHESDRNKTYDVESSNVVGIASNYYLTAGKVISFVSSPFGLAACAAVPLFLLVLIELIIAIATHSGREEEQDDTDEDEENVTLDDFLFGGENEKALHKNAKADDVPNVSEKENEQVSESEQPDENSQANSEIDRSYYEKASKLLDDAVVSDAEDDSEDSQTDSSEENEAENAPVAEQPAKTASASLEDLMKLMEEEQKRLREQLNK